MRLFAYVGFMVASVLSGCTGASTKTPIAILTPTTHPSLEEIEKGFKETMEKECPGKYRFYTYNAQGNKSLMRGEVEEMARKGYAAVLTIGMQSSQMTKEVFEKKGLTTPIVFTSITDPVGLGLVKSEERPGGQVTGVKEFIDFEKEIDFFLRLKPAIKTMLLVYNPLLPSLVEERSAVEKVLAARGVRLATAEVFQSNEFIAKLTPKMAKADAVLVLKDNTVVSGLDALVKLCNEYRVPLMTSELESPDRGAFCGYGIYEIESGIEGAKKIVQILEQGKNPGDIPVSPVTRISYKINQQAAALQGVDLKEVGALP